MTTNGSKDLIYLDNASTTFPKPREVIDFMANFYANYGVSPGRVRSEVALKAEEVIQDSREKLTACFGGTDPSRLVFGYNITDALNLLMNSVLKRGDHVVTTLMEHNAVLRPLYFLRKHKGVEVDFVPFDEAGYVDPDDVANKIRPNTKMVLVIHGSNVLGTVQPIKEIGNICRGHDVPLVVDTAQTAGLIPINARDMDLDIVCFTGHKSLMGPTGIGGMYVREGLKITPSRSGGTGILSEMEEQPEDFPYCLEFGTPNLIGIAGLLAAQEWMVSRGGIGEIHRKELELTRQLQDGLEEIDNIIFYGAELVKDHLPVMSFNLKGIDAPDVGDKLDLGYNIANRSGLHCAPLLHKALGTDKTGGTVRLSVGPFNTEQEIATTVEAMKEIAKKV